MLFLDGIVCTPCLGAWKCDSGSIPGIWGAPRRIRLSLGDIRNQCGHPPGSRNHSGTWSQRTVLSVNSDESRGSVVLTAEDAGQEWFDKVVA